MMIKVRSIIIVFHLHNILEKEANEAFLSEVAHNAHSLAGFSTFTSS